MRYLPISLNTKNSTIALLGNGEAAVNKLRLLVKTDAIIHLFASAPSVELIQYIQSRPNTAIISFNRQFVEADLGNHVAIFSCSENSAENEFIAKLAKQNNIPFNSPDNPEICTFYVPSIVDRSPVTVAISTEGTAPVLAKKIRAHIEQHLPQDIGKLALFAQNIRQHVQGRLTNMNEKRHFWENFFNGKIADFFHQGKLDIAKDLVEQSLDKPTEQIGKLYLIHASDPDLLSIKAARILQLADYIYQIEGTETNIEDFTNLARRDAHFSTVSSSPDKPQDGELIMQIAKQARENKTIIVIGDNSTKKRKNKIFTHLQNENIAIEHLYSAKSSNIYEQSIDEFRKQYL
ncbi:MAG: siroheme synthase [Rhizobiales bacterium]|nr:siroheme synthase [Hyphomicrobiales bacterium]